MATALKNDPRERLLETAARLFYAQGYRCTGINQIIEEAQVAKASFYHHFKSKEDLLIAYLERAHDVNLGKIRGFVTKGRTPAERIRRLFLFVEEGLKTGAYDGCPFQPADPGVSSVRPGTPQRCLGSSPPAGWMRRAGVAGRKVHPLLDRPVCLLYT